ncbi:hypothetical protein [Salinirubrum litoreum]|uniref:SPW repeat-containing protein n=1 Tax=Salinirubrum litoreum TaxID=1126234 RepID=A0ABD5R9H9_9EURY|nr:hypothetical protein [Salinirubrum litoreum]
MDELVRDGLLALLPAVALAGCVGWLAVPVTATPVVVGVAGTLLLELVLATRADTVRRYWRTSSVQAGAVGVLLVGLWLGWQTLGGQVLVVALAGLVTYLLLVGAVLVGLVPPTSQWVRE